MFGWEGVGGGKNTQTHRGSTLCNCEDEPLLALLKPGQCFNFLPGASKRKTPDSMNLIRGEPLLS